MLYIFFQWANIRRYTEIYVDISYINQDIKQSSTTSQNAEKNT